MTSLRDDILINLINVKIEFKEECISIIGQEKVIDNLIKLTLN